MIELKGFDVVAVLDALGHCRSQLVSGSRVNNSGDVGFWGPVVRTDLRNAAQEAAFEEMRS
jgi:hypothetical protein